MPKNVFYAFLLSISSYFQKTVNNREVIKYSNNLKITLLSKDVWAAFSCAEDAAQAGPEQVLGNPKKILYQQNKLFTRHVWEDL